MQLRVQPQGMANQPLILIKVAFPLTLAKMISSGLKMLLVPINLERLLTLYPLPKQMLSHIGSLPTFCSVVPKPAVGQPGSVMIHGTNSNKQKKNNTGIKHMVTNKIRLASQRDYFDTAPCVMIVPICSPDDAKAWHGEGYAAIMLIGAWNSVTLPAVACTTQFYHDDLAQATPDEIAIATQLLQHYTRGIVYAQKNAPAQSGFTRSAAWAYPELSKSASRVGKVRKITFSSHSDSGGHPAPDPILTVVKAISTLQRRNGFSLMAAAQPQEDDTDDLDALAETQYLEWRDQMAPNPIGLEVAVNDPGNRLQASTVEPFVSVTTLCLHV
jgi:hypothetical protein